MFVETKAIILLDSKSKSVIKTSISGLGMTGFRFISSLDGINDEMVSESHSLIVLEGFALMENSFFDLQMYRGLYELQLFFLGSKKYFQIYSEIAHCFECDLATITPDVIQAALYHDSSVEEKGSADYFDVTGKARGILGDRQSYPQPAIDVAVAYLSLLDKMEFYRERNVALTERNGLLGLENEKLGQDRRKLLDGYRQVLADAREMNRALRRYEAIFTKDIYEKVRLLDYVGRPMVLYFKEYEDFINLDGLLETLFNVFRVQKRKSVKVLRLFDSNTSRKLLTLPPYYRVIYSGYLMSDVVSCDFIAKTGNYRHVLEKILLNEAGVDILIIVDSKDFDDTVLTGASLQLNLCREVAHREAFGLDANNTILNEGDEGSGFYWGMYDVDGMSQDEKFVYLSSRGVIRNILGLCRVYEHTV